MKSVSNLNSGGKLVRKKLTPEEERRLEALNFEKAYRDRISMLADERAEGEAIGVAKEKAKRDKEISDIAANLKAMGMTDEQIRAALTTKVQDTEESEDMDFEL